jgi:acyl-CoA oxidase
MQEIEALAAGMKAYILLGAQRLFYRNVEKLLAAKVIYQNRIDALKNDTEIYTTFEGDNTVLMQLVAKNRLSEFRKSFGKMDAMGIINYVYENAKTAISEKNSIVTRKRMNHI